MAVGPGGSGVRDGRNTDQMCNWCLYIVLIKFAKNSLPE